MEHNEKQNEMKMEPKPSSSEEKDIIDGLDSASSQSFNNEENAEGSFFAPKGNAESEEAHDALMGKEEIALSDKRESPLVKLIDKVKLSVNSFLATIKEDELKMEQKPSSSKEDIIDEPDAASSLSLDHNENVEDSSFASNDDAQEDHTDDMSDDDDFLYMEESALLKQFDKVRTPIISFIDKRKENTGVLKGMFYALIPVIVILLLSGGMTLSAVGRDRIEEEEVLPESTDIYYYVSGVEMYASLYEDNSIRSDELARLENGDPVEFLYKENYKFAYVLDHNSGRYGYMFVDQLVSDIATVDYDQMLNPYEQEDSLGYYYVTNTKNGLTLWENPDGSGETRAKMENGCKVSLLEETNSSYWYVFDFQSTERGYVKKAYLTGDEDAVVGVKEEPEDKTIVGEYYVNGVNSYLSLRSEPSSDASLRGKLSLGDKVGLIEKTSGTYWYVYSYSLGEYGYVVASYLSTEDPTAEEEEAEEEEEEASDDAEELDETEESNGSDVSDGSDESEEPDASEPAEELESSGESEESGAE